MSSESSYESGTDDESIVGESHPLLKDPTPFLDLQEPPEQAINLAEKLVSTAPPAAAGTGKSSGSWKSSVASRFTVDDADFFTAFPAMVWLSYVWWSVFEQYVVYVYAYCLNSLSLSFSVVLLIFLWAPVVLGFRLAQKFAALISPGIFLVAHLSLVSHLINSVLARLLFLSLAMSMYAVAILARLLSRNEHERRRDTSALALGFIFAMVVRISNCSVNPFFVSWIWNLVVLFVSLHFCGVLVFERALNLALHGWITRRNRRYHKAFVRMESVAVENGGYEDDSPAADVTGDGVDDEKSVSAESSPAAETDRLLSKTAADEEVEAGSSAGSEVDAAEHPQSGRIAGDEGRAAEPGSDSASQRDAMEAVEQPDQLEAVGGVASEQEWEQTDVRLQRGSHNEEPSIEGSKGANVQKKPLDVARKVALYCVKAIWRHLEGVRVGVGVGGYLFAALWLFFSSSILPRWVEVQPFPAGILIVVFLLLGLVFLSECPVVQNSPLYFCIFAPSSMALLVYCSGAWGMIGACVQAVFLASIWPKIARRMLDVSPAPMFCTAAVCLVGFLLCEVCINGFQFVPWTSFLFKRHGVLALACLVFGAIFFGMYRVQDFVFFVSPKRYAIAPPRMHMLASFAVFVCLIGLAVGARYAVLAVSRHQNEYIDDGRLRVMSYNVHVGFTREGDFNFFDILRIIREQHADVVGLQETDTVQVYTGARDLVEYLSAHLKMKSNFGPGTRVGTFGSALISRFELRDSKGVVPTSAAGERATLTADTFHFHSVGLRILNTHFSLIRDVRVDEAHYMIKKAREFAAFNESSTSNGTLSSFEPVIATGDFNEEPQYEPYKVLVSYFVDTFPALHNGTHKSTLDLGKSSEKTIDYVFVNRNRRLQPVRSWVADSDYHASDHVPVMCEFAIGAPPEEQAATAV